MILGPGAIAPEFELPDQFGAPQRLADRRGVRPVVLAFVPFASVCQSYWWLYLWARAGIRNEFQSGCSARQTAALNERFLREETNYLSQRAIRSVAGRYFGRAKAIT